MARIGEEAARAFKALAGQDTNEPLGAHVIALYCFLLLVAMMLAAAWITGTPMECLMRATC